MYPRVLGVQISENRLSSRLQGIPIEVSTSVNGLGLQKAPQVKTSSRLMCLHVSFDPMSILGIITIVLGSYLVFESLDP